MKVDLFPTPVRKYNVPNNDKHLSHWTEEYNDSKFEEVSPLVLGYTHIDRRLSESYIGIINEFVNDIGVSETHSYTIQSYMKFIISIIKIFNYKS